MNAAKYTQNFKTLYTEPKYSKSIKHELLKYIYIHIHTHQSDILTNFAVYHLNQSVKINLIYCSQLLVEALCKQYFDFKHHK